MAAGRQEPCWAAGLAQLCTRPAQACSAWLCHDSEPRRFSTGHQTLPRGPAGAHSWDQQLWWCGHASSLPLLLSSRGQGCQPEPEEQPLLLQLLPPLSPCAKRELLLPDGQLARVGLLLFFTCCVLTVGACLQHSPQTALLTHCGTGLPCSAGNHGLVTLGTPSLPPVAFVGAVVAQRWPVTYSLRDARFFADLFKRLLSGCTM